MTNIPIFDTHENGKRLSSVSPVELHLPLRLRARSALNPVYVTIFWSTDDILIPGEPLPSSLYDLIDLNRPLYDLLPVFGPDHFRLSPGDIVAKVEHVDYLGMGPVDPWLDVELYLVGRNQIVECLDRREIEAHAARMARTGLPECLRGGTGIATDCVRVMWSFRQSHRLAAR